jgi:hypothetical protein
MQPASDVLARLEADGLIRREGERYRSTRRWQAAMARAAFHMYGTGDQGGDLRVPIVRALLEVYGDLPDLEIVRFVEQLLPIEAAELDPRNHIAPRASP